MEEQTKLIRLNEVIGRCGLKKSSIYKMIKEEKFPKPVKIGPRASAWNNMEITTWINTRTRVIRYK